MEPGRKDWEVVVVGGRAGEGASNSGGEVEGGAEERVRGSTSRSSSISNGCSVSEMSLN